MVITPPGEEEATDEWKGTVADKLLKLYQLVPLFGFLTTWGNCFYDVIALLLKLLSHPGGPLTSQQIRDKAIKHLESKSMHPSLHHGRDLTILRLKTPGDCPEPKRAGWADMFCVAAVAKALSIQIKCHYADGSCRDLARCAPEGSPQYNVLFVGESENGTGHYYPCVSVPVAASLNRALVGASTRVAPPPCPPLPPPAPRHRPPPRPDDDASSKARCLPGASTRVRRRPM